MINNNREKLGDRRPFCPDCQVKTTYLYSGIYECPVCGKQIMDDFGKVKSYLDKNKKASIAQVSIDTGVSIETITELLRRGKVEIPDGSPIYIDCEQCGAPIRYGRFCPECSRKLSKDLTRAFFSEDVGERPTKVQSTKNGKMHIMNTLRKGVEGDRSNKL